MRGGKPTLPVRMAHHDFAVPIRFLALVGHFFAALLALFAVRDNVIVALPFRYHQIDLDGGLQSARAAVIFCLCVMAVNAIGFFCGFSTFHLPSSIFRAHMEHRPPNPAPIS